MVKGSDFDFYDPNKRPAEPAPKPKFEPLSFECCECGELARFGEGVALKKGIEGTWYCRAHAPAEFFPKGR